MSVYFRGYPLGALPPDKFLLLNMSLTGGGVALSLSPMAAFAFAVVLGAVSALSPCVFRRWLWLRLGENYFIGGGVFGYVAWSTALTLPGMAVVLDKNISAALVALLGVLYFLGVRGPYWRIQTFFHRVAKGSDS